jgi:hypothetical protein
VRSGRGKNGQEPKKKSTVVSSKKKWTEMNPIRRRMKKATHPVDRTANWCIGGCWFTLAYPGEPSTFAMGLSQPQLFGSNYNTGPEHAIFWAGSNSLSCQKKKFRA